MKHPGMQPALVHHVYDTRNELYKPIQTGLPRTMQTGLLEGDLEAAMLFAMEQNDGVLLAKHSERPLIPIL